jgi:hypothetical protein
MQKNAFVLFRDLPYDEPELHIELRASNGSTSATQDFYCYSEDLETFGRELSSFPTSTTSEARLEAGNRDPGWAHFVLVRAFVYDRVGHSALEIDVESHSEDPYGQSARFHILCEPASLNKLGAQLLAWCRDRQQALEWRPAV